MVKSHSRFDAEYKAIDELDLDSVAAIISMSGPLYLLQHRDDRDGVAFPNCWGLFGGARERGESAVAALRRELMEELNFEVGAYEPVLGCTYELWFEARRARKAFFSIEMTMAEASDLVLREGQGMAWLRFEEIMARADRVVPYDLSVIALHNRGTALGGFQGLGVRPAPS